MAKPCERCAGKGWIDNKPPWPLLGPMSIECPECFGTKVQKTKAPDGTVVCYEYTGPEFEDDDLPF